MIVLGYALNQSCIHCLHTFCEISERACQRPVRRSAPSIHLIRIDWLKRTATPLVAEFLLDICYESQISSCFMLLIDALLHTTLDCKIGAIFFQPQKQKVDDAAPLLSPTRLGYRCATMVVPCGLATPTHGLTTAQCLMPGAWLCAIGLFKLAI